MKYNYVARDVAGIAYDEASWKVTAISPRWYFNTFASNIKQIIYYNK